MTIQHRSYEELLIDIFYRSRSFQSLKDVHLVDIITESEAVIIQKCLELIRKSEGRLTRNQIDEMMGDPK